MVAFTKGKTAKGDCILISTKGELFTNCYSRRYATEKMRDQAFQAISEVQATEQLKAVLILHHRTN